MKTILIHTVWLLVCLGVILFNGRRHAPPQLREEVPSQASLSILQGPSASRTSRPITEQPGSESLAERAFASAEQDPEHGHLLREVRETVRTSLAQATREAAKIDDRGVREIATQAIADHLVDEDPGVVDAWLETLSDEGMRHMGFSWVAAKKLVKDVDAAADWVLNHAEHPAARGAIANVAGKLGEEDPEAALAWAGRLPSGPASEHGHLHVFGRWAGSDPVSAADYLDALPPSANRDRGVEALVSLLADDDPLLANDWAESISSEAIQSEAKDRIARNWSERDPEKAMEWALTNLDRGQYEQLQRDVASHEQILSEIQSNQQQP